MSLDARPPSPAASSSDRSAGPLPWPDHDDHLTPFLPMVYVAWSDGVLTASEMRRIREEIAGADELPDSPSRILDSWLEPEAPPSPVELAQLLARIKAVAKRLRPEELRSLVSLGIALARAHAEDEGGWAGEHGTRVLVAVEDLLGVLGGEAARDLAETREAVSPERPGLPGVDTAALRSIMDGEWTELRARIMNLLADPTVRVPDGLPRPEARALTLAALRRLADEGIGALAFPEDCGGAGDPMASMIAFEALGYGNLSVLIKFGVQFGLFGGSILQLGTTRHHRRYLPEVGTLELPGIFAMTERSHGSNVRDIETVARYLPDSDELEIHTPSPEARKDWLGNAALHGHMATVFAQLEVGGEPHGVHAILVPVRTEDGAAMPGVDIEDCGQKVGLNGIDNGRLAFDHVRVPRENLLDRFARITDDGHYESPIASPGRRFFTMLGTLVAGRVSIAAGSVSAAKSGLAIAVRYSDMRRQFGPSGGREVPVLDYLLQQRLLLVPLATTFAHHFAVRALIARFGTDPDDSELREIEVLAAGLKAHASRNAMDALQACRESMGGRGYLAENRLGYLREDVDIFTTFEGTNVVLLQLVAKSLLSEYRQGLTDLRIWDIVRLVGERAGEEAARRNPLRSRRTLEDFLRDPEAQMEALRFREERLLHTVARRIKHRIDQGMDSFHAMNECQDHLVSLADAHVERVVLGGFRDAIQASGADAALRPVLDSLADLYALSRLEADRAWFLESGYMEGSQTKAIRTLVNSLCADLRPRAVDLAAGFGIPDEVLAAPDALERRL